MVIVCPPTDFTLTAYILPQIFIVAEVSCLRRSKGSPTEYADLTEVFAENILPQISFLLRIFSHRFHRIHRTSCCVYSPTDFTDLHRWLGCVYPPTDFTDLHRLFGCLQGGALVSSAPTEQEVHQPEISSFCVDLCNLWESLCCCGGKDTSATIFRTLTICVDLCHLWEVIPSRRFCEFCVICGRIFRTQTICVDLCNPWEVIPSRRFCEFCSICGRIFRTQTICVDL